ncbi:protein translocase subunit SecF, partial [Candidatus Peregrinibacteria bacterium]|nr:protein translocase subunit SecF [Candidatus Peregrinibacteria bacterium]
IWFGFSGILIAISLLAIIFFGFKLGLDFTGGTLLEVKFENKAVTTESIQGIFEAITPVETDFGSPVIIPTDQNTFIIRTKHLDNETHTQFTESLKNSLGNFEQIRFTTIGPTIGATLKKRAVSAIAIALVMIILYIAFAFRKIPKHINPWRFGVCAIVALIHDVIISVGAFVIFGKLFNVEIDALFITAILTIIGFSVHDTIVVFDRIRENLRYQNKGDTLDTIANKAMNQTMARSINTSLSTLLTITALAIFGVSSIRFFVIALIVGITIGTYSSIFTASPLLITWKNWVSRPKQ